MENKIVWTFSVKPVAEQYFLWISFVFTCLTIVIICMCLLLIQWLLYLEIKDCF